ncbi:MAG: hypothetical protein AAFV33_20525 [Chloroflexota bacterium]
MQTLNRLVNAAAIINDLARQKHTHVLPVMDDDITVYLHTDDAAVRIIRWDKPQVEAMVETLPALAWRVATDYDENGVYVVAIKRPGFGQIARASMNVLVPRDAHLVLRMNNGLVSLDHVRGTLHIAPPADAPDVVSGYLPENN